MNESKWAEMDAIEWDRLKYESGLYNTAVVIPGSISPMFYKKWITRTVRLHPQSFGRRMEAILRKTLESEVRGVALSNYGYCICVTQVKPGGGGGKIQEGTGFAIFQLEFEAILFRPFVKEVLDVKVTDCVELGFFAYAGPIKVFVSRHQMPENMQEGFDAVSESWISDDKNSEIAVNSRVRLQLIQVKLEDREWVGVGTIDKDYLGVIRDE